MKNRRLVTTRFEEEYTRDQLERDTRGRSPREVTRVTRVREVGDDSNIDTGVLPESVDGLLGSFTATMSADTDVDQDTDFGLDVEDTTTEDADVATGDIDDSMPAVAELKMKQIFFETVIEDAIDKAIEDNDGDVTFDQVQEEVMPAVDKAISLYKIPPTFRNRVNSIFSNCMMKHQLMKEEQSNFLLKLAYRMSEEEVASIDETVTVSEEVREGVAPAEAKPVADEVVTPDDVAIEPSVPENAAAAMKYMVASAVNHRKATALSIRRVAVPVFNKYMDEFKHCLPKRVRDIYYK